VSKGQGAITAITATCTDAAGQVGTGADYAPIDTTPPVVTVTGVSSGAVYSLHNYPASPQCKTTDAVSGVAKKAVASFTSPPVKSAGHAGTAGVWSISCSGAQDKAGNKAPMAHATWTVGYEFGGFSAPRANSTLSHTAKAITVHMSLADGSGRPIAGGE